MEEVLYKLLNIVNNNSSGDTEYSIAMGLLKNIVAIGKLSIEQMADKCYTSTASLSRFCRKLGFSNYSLFKSSFNQNPSELLMSSDHNVYYSHLMSEQKIINRVIEKQINILSTFKEEIDANCISEIIDEINNAEAIYLICNKEVQASIFDFQYKMLLAGKYVEYRRSDWIQSYSTKPHSLRIQINIFTVEGYSSMHSNIIGIDIAERINSKDKRLVDLKVIITDEVPIITTKNNRNMEDGKNCSMILSTFLKILSIAYSEKYVLSKRSKK